MVKCYCIKIMYCVIVIVTIFLNINHTFAKSTITCQFCDSEDCELYKTNSSHGLTERIYFCKTCKRFSSVMVYDEDIKKIIEDDEDVSDSEETGSSKETVKSNTNETTKKSEQSSDSEDDAEERKSKSTIYPEEPEGDYFVIRNDDNDKKNTNFIEEVFIDKKNISFKLAENGALILIDVTKLENIYTDVFITEIDEKHNKMRTWYSDRSGTLQVGWRLINGWWYYFLDESNEYAGTMAKGWQCIRKKYYYFDLNGKLLVDTVTPDGYNVNKEGVCYEKTI